MEDKKIKHLEQIADSLEGGDEEMRQYIRAQREGLEGIFEEKGLREGERKEYLAIHIIAQTGIQYEQIVQAIKREQETIALARSEGKTAEDYAREKVRTYREEIAPRLKKEIN